MFRILYKKATDFSTEAPVVTPLFTGAAGEFAVLSELLFRGFNASKMTVDDGIDVVASKNDRYLHIQVKTANERSGVYSATLRSKAFQHASNVFYIVVLRAKAGARYTNDYVILQSGVIKKMILQGKIKEGNSISLRISAEGKSIILNGSEDVSVHKNNWELICQVLECRPNNLSLVSWGWKPAFSPCSMANGNALVGGRMAGRAAQKRNPLPRGARLG